jgi:hypothetical protein
LLEAIYTEPLSTFFILKETSSEGFSTKWDETSDPLLGSITNQDLKKIFLRGVFLVRPKDPIINMRGDSVLSAAFYGLTGISNPLFVLFPINDIRVSNKRTKSWGT